MDMYAQSNNSSSHYYNNNYGSNNEPDTEIYTSFSGDASVNDCNSSSNGSVNSYSNKRRRDSKQEGSSPSKCTSSSPEGKEAGKNVPVFLRKTFTMISSCNENIAGWSTDGKSFIIKDMEKFGSRVIPEFFKHNNISSFIRQLNFYGFRKVRSNALRLSDLRETEEAKYCKFAHEKFQRGRADLLCEIKKPPPTVSHNAEQKEVDALKKEIKDLEDKLNSMSVNMKGLKKSVSVMVTKHESIMPPSFQGNLYQLEWQDMPVHYGGMDMSGHPVGSVAMFDEADQMSKIDFELDPLPFRPSIAPLDADENDYKENGYECFSPPYGHLTQPTQRYSRGESTGAMSLLSMNGEDDLDFWNDAMATSNLDTFANQADYMPPPPTSIHHNEYPANYSNPLPIKSRSAAVPKTCLKKQETVDQAALDRLCGAVTQMPTNVQELLVNRMIQVLACDTNGNAGTTINRYERQVEDLKNLAAEAAEYATRYEPKVEYQPVPLAVESAILGSYLDRKSR